MATWDDVRELALSLPETEEGTTYRKPAVRVAGKVFAWMSPSEDGALVVYVDPGERPFLVASQPGLYFVTPHYEGHPMMLVKLGDASTGHLRELIEDSWALRAPKRLIP